MESTSVRNKILYIVVPCYNEEEVLPETSRRLKEKLAALVKLQADILDACASRVAPGGVLVSSTCSNEPEENEAQVTAFLARHPDFSLAESRESIPFESGTDGAFAARLRRNLA